MADDLHKFAERMRALPARLGPKAAEAIAQGLFQATIWGYANHVDVHGKEYIRAKDGHLPQMIRSGALRNSVTHKTEWVGSWAGVVSTDVPYEEYLRLGTSKMYPREHLPAPNQPPPLRYQQILDAWVQPLLHAAVDRVCR